MNRDQDKNTNIEITTIFKQVIILTSFTVLKFWLGKHLALLFDHIYYNVHQNKENQWGLVQEQKLETQTSGVKKQLFFMRTE